MKRLIVVSLLIVASIVAFGGVALAQSAPEFKLGFKTLADQLPADVVGTPTENEHFNLSNGNSEQHTTKGLMVWRKADNWTAYTNGYMTWINGPNGVQSRLNTDRFDWEKDAWQASPGPQATPTPAPTPPPASLLAPGADWTVIDRSSDEFKVSLPPNWQQVDPRSTELSSDLARIFKDQPNGALAARVHAASASAAKLMGGVLYAFPVTGESAAEPGSTQFKITKLAVPASMTLDQVVAQAVSMLDQQASQGIISNLTHHRTALPAGNTEVFTYLETIKLEGMPEMRVAVLDCVLVRGGYAYELVFATMSASGVNEIAQVGDAIGQSFQFTTPAPQAAADIQPIKLLQTGYGQEIDDTNAGFGFVVENPNDGFLLDGTYTVTAYDEKGAFLKTVSDTIGVVLPKQRLGIGGYLLRLPNSRIARIDVQLQTTTFTPSPQLPFITASNVVYNASKYVRSAIADLSNPYDRDVNKPNVFAIVYNSDGVIIGGGSAKTILSMPAHGQTKGGAEIVSSGPPSRIEVYAQPTYNAGWPW